MPRSINLSNGTSKCFGCDAYDFLVLDTFCLHCHRMMLNLLSINVALLYNKARTQFHKDATRIQKESGSILNTLQKLVTVRDLPSGSIVEGEVKSGTHGFDNLPPIGDLELHLDMLESLISSECHKENLKLAIILSLLYSTMSLPHDNLLRRKEKTKPKRDRKAEVEPGPIKWLLPLLQELMFGKQRRKGLRGGKSKRSHRLLWMVHLVFVFLGPEVRLLLLLKQNLVDRRLLAMILRSSKVNGFRKRASVAPVGQTSVPKVVIDVDNQGSFYMFNAGWILPPDRKRGERASAMDRSALPPPRKRPRTGALKLFPTWRFFVDFCVDRNS